MKSTCENFRTPAVFSTCVGSSASLMEMSIFNTSSIRSAATPARGSMTDIIVSIRNAITISIAYVINAVMEPTCITPRSIFFAATQTIATVSAYMISIIPGIISVMTRFVKSMVFVSSRFTPSNRSSSLSSRRNARITGSPVSISLETRLTSSTFSCICLNFGIATLIRPMTNTIIIITATTISHPIPAFVCTTLMIPPIPIIGA